MVNVKPSEVEDKKNFVKSSLPSLHFFSDSGRAVWYVTVATSD